MFEQLLRLSQKGQQLKNKGNETWQHLWSLIAQALTFYDSLIAWPLVVRRIQFRYQT